mgnify:CR=1 FL=1
MLLWAISIAVSMTWCMSCQCFWGLLGDSNLAGWGVTIYLGVGVARLRLVQQATAASVNTCRAAASINMRTNSHTVGGLGQSPQSGRGICNSPAIHLNPAAAAVAAAAAASSVIKCFGMMVQAAAPAAGSSRMQPGHSRPGVLRHMQHLQLLTRHLH